MSKNTPKPADAVPATVEAENPLLLLGGLIAEAQITEKMGEPNEIYAARGFITGVVVSCRHLLPPAQFRSVMVQWEIDEELLETMAELFKPEY